MNLIKKYRELISYGIFGVLTTVINWVIYTLLSLNENISMTVCNGAAWICAVLFAYVTNRIFVFQSKGRGLLLLLKEMGLFFGSRIFTGVIEIAGPSLLFWCGITQSWFGIRGFLAKLITSVAVIILNYILSKVLVFRKREK